MANKPHFDISAAVVRQLGEELVSDEVTAIVELVKNAYDADATYANVAVNTSRCSSVLATRFPKAKGHITIEDDGFGMSQAEIEGGWLVISLSTKRSMKRKGEKTPKGRTPLGDKGLGRLSTQKLGDNLEMITRKDGAAQTIHVSFSWSEFTDQRSLGTVPVKIGTAAMARKKGTLLVVSELRNSSVWQGATLETLSSDLAQIISPFPEARPFLVTLTVNDTPIDLAQISTSARRSAAGRFTIDYGDRELVLRGKLRLARLRGQTEEDQDFFDEVVLADNGKTFFDYLATQRPPVTVTRSQESGFFIEFDYTLALGALGEVETVAGPNTGKTEPADPGPFHSEIDEFVLRADVIGGGLGTLSSLSEIQKLVRRHAGIKVFRDGFAIRPYGINGEDWLRLGAKQTSGSSWYGLRPNNVVGFVSISEASNPLLKDKTDREGLVSNPHANNFRRLMAHSTATIDTFYEWLRRSYNKFRSARRAAPNGLSESRRLITNARDVSRALTAYKHRGSKLITGTSSIRSRLSEIKEGMAQTGANTAAERRLKNLLEQARYALEHAESVFGDIAAYADEASKLEQIVSSLSPRIDVLSDQLKDFSELAGLGLLAEALSHEVLNQTDRLLQLAKSASVTARKATPPNAELIRFADEVSSAAFGLRRQVGHLSSSMRYQRERLETLPISKIVADAVAHFRERLERRDIHIQVAAGGSDFAVRANRGRLVQVIDNLILNSEYWLHDAANRQPRQGVITLEIARPVLRVYDNGFGVDPAVENNLFEPFITLKPKERGRGLGLFITRQILDSMGCSISLLPLRNDDGRRFVFQVDLSGVVSG